MAADANGFINDVWIAGDMMARMVNLNGETIPPGVSGVYPYTILVSNHDSVTYARNSTVDPSTLSSAKQSKDSLLPFTTNFVVVADDPNYYWAWNVLEWEFVPFTGAPYTILAASLAGRAVSTELYQGWAAFGAVKYPTVINTGEIVVYLESFFRVGYGPGETP